MVDCVFVGIREPDRGPALLAPAAGDGGKDAGLGFEKHLLLIGGERNQKHRLRAGT